MIRRDELARVFGNDHRIIEHFEEQAELLESASTLASSSAAATDQMQDATVIVLSANGAFTGERVLRRGPGIAMYDTGTALIIQASDDVLLVGDVLEDITLDAPILTIGDYVDDAAAAAAGVPLMGVYHNAGALRVRIV